MVAFSGCGKANSAECPDLRTLKEYNDGVTLGIRARDDISIHNIIINRGNCMYSFSDYRYRGVRRNGVDRIQDARNGEPLTSDYIEQSIKEEYREKIL